MKLTQFAFLLVASLLFSQLIYASFTGNAFEIKFSPGDSVYRLTLNEEQRLYDCVIHNFSVADELKFNFLKQKRIA